MEVVGGLLGAVGIVSLSYGFLKRAERGSARWFMLGGALAAAMGFALTWSEPEPKAASVLASAPSEPLAPMQTNEPAPAAPQPVEMVPEPALPDPAAEPVPAPVARAAPAPASTRSKGDGYDYDIPPPAPINKEGGPAGARGARR
jgi:hypothetical protein